MMLLFAELTPSVRSKGTLVIFGHTLLTPSPPPPPPKKRRGFSGSTTDHFSYCDGLLWVLREIS